MHTDFLADGLYSGGIMQYKEGAPLGIILPMKDASLIRQIFSGKNLLQAGTSASLPDMSSR